MQEPVLKINSVSQEEFKLPLDDIQKKRIYSFSLDLIFISLLNKMLFYTYVQFLDYHLPQINPVTKKQILSHFLELQFPIYIIIFIAYFTISYYISNGKTPAKMIFGIKIQGTNIFDDNISLMEASLRSSCYFLGIFLGFFLLLIPLFKKNRKGIPDIVSQTSVYTEYQIELLKKHAHDKKTTNKDIEMDKSQLELFAS